MSSEKSDTETGFNFFDYYDEIMTILRNLEKETTAEKLLYFYNMDDSNQTFFESISNERMVGVTSNNEKVAMFLLWITKVIYSNLETPYIIVNEISDDMENYEYYKKNDDGSETCELMLDFIKKEDGSFDVKKLVEHANVFIYDFSTYDMNGKNIDESGKECDNDTLLINYMIPRKILSIDDVDEYFKYVDKCYKSKVIN